MHAEKVRDRQTDRQTDRCTGRQTETQRQKDRDGETETDRQNLLWSVSCLVEHPAMKPKNRCLHSLLLFIESTWIQSAPAAYAAQTSTQLRHTSFSSVAWRSLTNTAITSASRKPDDKKGRVGRGGGEQR